MKSLTRIAALLAVLGLTVGLMSASASPSPFTDKIHKKERSVLQATPGSESGAMAGMTAAHNKVRDAVGQGIPKLTWDSKIATYAAEWAKVQSKNCAAMDHRPNNPYGENIAGGFGTSKAQDAVNLWLEEKKDFDSGKKKCKSGKTCGHYTQMIWKKTTKVGCGYAACDCSKSSNCWGPDSTIWVCNYSPPGNYSGEKPY